MYCYKLTWKEYNLDLPAVNAWMQSNAGEFYTGMSADYTLNLWFSEEPAAEMLITLQTYWDELTSESTEAVNYLPYETLVAAREALREGLAAKTWDEMSVAERKLVLGQAVTREELGL